MITAAPIMFMIVIGSPNNANANSMMKTKLVPLNIYAVLNSTRFKICCQHIAYAPITHIAPANSKQ